MQFGGRKVAEEKGFGVRVRIKGDIDGFEWRLVADSHQIERGCGREGERQTDREREGFLKEEWYLGKKIKT